MNSEGPFPSRKLESTEKTATWKRGIVLVPCLLLWLAACTPAVASPTGTIDQTATRIEPTSEPASSTLKVTDPPTATLPTQATDTSPGLDLRYANVLAVEFEQLDDGRYRFHVTLQHDDDGEAPQYADAWQIEDLEGSVLGVRELLHSHGNQPFTRSHTIEIPQDVEVVIVRGHDQKHGYGGQIMRADLRSGETAPLATTPSPAP